MAWRIRKRCSSGTVDEAYHLLDVVFFFKDLLINSYPRASNPHSVFYLLKVDLHEGLPSQEAPGEIPLTFALINNLVVKLRPPP